jgi:hypothetical protein
MTVAARERPAHRRWLLVSMRGGGVLAGMLLLALLVVREGAMLRAVRSATPAVPRSPLRRAAGDGDAILWPPPPPPPLPSPPSPDTALPRPPPLCATTGAAALALGDRELTTAFDCLCVPRAAPRPPHCRFLILQSGDYALDASPPFTGIGDMPFHTASRIAMQLYAAAHGYAYLYVDVRGRTAARDRAAAWMKLPAMRVLARYFDYVLYVDPDVAPGANFTTPLTGLAALLGKAPAAPGPGGVGGGVTSLVAAGNGPSHEGGPCTGVLLLTATPGLGGGTALGELLGRWWAAPDADPEFAPYKTRHTWEQHVLERFVRRRAELARNVTRVLPPAMLGNPGTPFLPHYWSDGSAEVRRSRVQRALLEALVAAMGSCGLGERCAPLLLRIATWRHYLPVVGWGELSSGEEFGPAFWRTPP